MAFRRALWCLFCAFAISFVHSEITLCDLSGVWRGYTPSAGALIITPEGVSGACVNTFPEECQAQLPPTEQECTFSGTTLSFEARSRVGITTREQSAALAPACAKNNIYPVESLSTVPPSEIISYDSKSEKVYYIDPRRPEEVNCVAVRYRMGDQGPYLEVAQTIVYQGTNERISALGPSYVCESRPGRCALKIEETGMVNGSISFVINLICIAGDCLNTAKATPPSTVSTPNESLVDI